MAKKKKCARCEEPIFGAVYIHDGAPYTNLPLCSDCDNHLRTAQVPPEPEPEATP